MDQSELELTESSVARDTTVGKVGDEIEGVSNTAATDLDAISSTSESDETNSRMAYGVAVSNVGFIIPEGLRTEVFLDPKICKIPLSPVWMKGVISVRGATFPVVDLGVFLTASSEKFQTRFVIAVQQADDMVGFYVNQLPRQIMLSDNDSLRNFPPLPDSIVAHVTKCFKNETGLWIDWDLQGFVRSIVNQYRYSN